MLTLPQASPGTRRLWGNHQCHAVRIESVILLLSFLSLILAGAQVAKMHSPYLGIWNFPTPFLSLVLSTGALVAFTRRTLDPVYSVSIATLLFCCWTVTLFFSAASDALFVQPEVDEIGYWSAPPGLLIVKDLFFGVTALTYLVYIGFAAKAVDDCRRRKRQGVLHLDDDMGVELVNKSTGPGTESRLQYD